jgi:hypothetical protein
MAKTVESVKVVESPEDIRHNRIMEIHKKLSEILVIHGGLESNIPVDSRVPNEYWTLKAELNALRATV